MADTVAKLTERGVSVSDLHRLLILDEENGSLTWRHRDLSEFGSDRIGKAWNGAWASKPALAAKGGGYRSGSIMGKPFKAHRVIFAMHHGFWPSAHVDHINGNGLDNRPCNLRDVPKSINQKNMRKPKNNTSGHIGVCWHSGGGKWMAYIDDNGKRLHLGLFSDIDDAVAARANEQKRLGYHENHGAR